ncbi:hypothetical protein ACFZBU_31845 [Embleya sp. NPDC008237]|uniref:hypothetical protein n=1 Tax=Embleya sp. NPDC008237 TaxID=3363978 RepID=UPI0036E41F11
MTALLGGGRLVFDSSPLNYFARSNQLDKLGRLVDGHRCVITRVVEEEILNGTTKSSRLHHVLATPWISVVDEPSLGYIARFSEYHSRMGGGMRNLGECATLAYAEFHGICAVVDDRAGRAMAIERGTQITGSLQLICRGIRDGMITEDEASGVVDILADHEAFLPCSGSEFIDWARGEGLLDL